MLRSPLCLLVTMLLTGACAGKNAPVPSPAVTRIHEGKGVTVDEIKDGDGGAYRIGTDSSEGGAVLCVRALLMYAYSDLEGCDDARARTFMVELREGIERIDRFIAQNTPDHPGVEAQRKATQEEILRAAEHRPVSRSCARFASQSEEALAQGREEYRKSIDQLLAVPRLPVMNPCL